MFEWMDKGNCKGLGPAVMDPDPPRSHGRKPKDHNPLEDPRSLEDLQIMIAKHYCSTCVVSADCLEYAITNREDHGVWGNTTASQRLKIRQARARSTAA